MAFNVVETSFEFETTEEIRDWTDEWSEIEYRTVHYDRAVPTNTIELISDLATRDEADDRLFHWLAKHVTHGERAKAYFSGHSIGFHFYWVREGGFWGNDSPDREVLEQAMKEYGNRAAWNASRC